jgi:hypothetical protein
MEVKYNTSSSFSVIESDKGVYHLVKVLGSYNSKDEAFKDMYKLMTKEVTEKQIEDKWREKK